MYPHNPVATLALHQAVENADGPSRLLEQGSDILPGAGNQHAADLPKAGGRRRRLPPKELIKGAVFARRDSDPRPRSLRTRPSVEGCRAATSRAASN